MNYRIDHLRATLRDDPGSRLFFQLGDLLRKAGELDEAEVVLARGLESHPRYVAAMMSLGRIQLDKAQFPDAERSFARALELDPENAVAARLIAETAERVGEWVRAIKAYKLARALMPGNAEVQERIEAIERRLLVGGSSELEVPPAEAPVGDAETAGPGSDATSDGLDPPEPFSLSDPIPTSAEPFGVLEPSPRPRNLISVSEDDPFAAAATGDTGVWMVADDVFVPPQPELETSSDDVFGGGSDLGPLPALEAEAEDKPDLEVELEPDFEPGFVPAPEPAAEQGPEIVPVAEIEIELVATPEGEPESIPDASHGQPLPTVTLARLALAQDDTLLALATLRDVLEVDPENWEAAELLKQLDEEVPPVKPEPLTSEASIPSTDLLVAKTARLKGWMEGIRTATERRAQ